MRDYVFATIETVNELLKKSQDLGFSEVVLLAEPKKAVALQEKREEIIKDVKIIVLFGIIAQNKAQIPKKYVFDVVAKLGTSEKTVFEGLDYVIDVEFDNEKDYVHQRRSGLNHVLLTEYKKKKISLLFGFASLQTQVLARQAQVLGRVMQNIQLCKKQNISYELCSLATLPKQLRHPKDVLALERVLGL